MSRRIISILIALVICLIAMSSFGRFTSAAAAPADQVMAKRTAAARNIASTSATLARSAIKFATAEASGASIDVLRLALNAVTCATVHGDIAPPPTLTLIDYSRPSLEPRLWVFDLRTGRMLYKELVAHGRNTGENMATRFSDTMNSLQSSIGLFVTRDPYVGSNGYSLRLDGLEPGFNGRARERAIVMHGAPYVNAATATNQGRLGRSWGCPALREAIARDVIDTIRGGGVIFSYFPDPQWLRTSRFLTGCAESPAPTPDGIELAQASPILLN